MLKQNVFILSLFFSLSLQGVIASPPTLLEPSPDRGLYLFQAYCVACHGEDGKGDGPMVGKLHRDFRIRPTDLSKLAFHDRRGDADLEKAIAGGGAAVHGTSFMPAWGATLNDWQVKDMVAFVRELKGSPLGDRPAMISVQEHLESGRRLYGSHCLACHGRQGEGDGPFLQGLVVAGTLVKAPPSLADYSLFRGLSDRQLEDNVRSGIGHSGIKADVSKWRHRSLDDDDVRALIFYLRVLPLRPVKTKT